MTALDIDSEFKALLDYIKHHRGFDLLAYKRSGLICRIQKRMHVISIDNYSDYIDYLEVWSFD